MPQGFLPSQDSHIRLRVFAGPNGAGKSTIYSQICKKYKCGVHVNADDIDRQLRAGGHLYYSDFMLDGIAQGEWENYYSTHALYTGKQSLAADDKGIYLINGKFPTSYECAILADYIREKLILQHVSFSFETVFSHPSKVDFLKRAKRIGYRVYLYFVCLQQDLCEERVRLRVKQGGHDVPKDKIHKRYNQSIENMVETVAIVDRAYLFDNSGSDIELKIEFDNSGNPPVIPHSDHLPEWLLKGFGVE